MGQHQRREFIKKSILGISGMALIPDILNATLAKSRLQNEIPDLPNRILGRTGIRTPLISLGTATIGESNVNLIKAAYFAGIKLFFSATYYRGGSNEKMVGKGLKGLPRNSFLIGTAAPPDGLDTRTGSLAKPVDVNTYIKKAEESLSRFGLDYIDIFLFPYAGNRDGILNKSLLKALQELKKRGIIKYAGIATHNNCAEALKAAADSKFYDVAMTSYNYRIENKEEMYKALSYAAKAGVGVVAMKTTGGGGFRDGTTKLPLNSDTILKWVLQNENIATIVAGMSNFEELNKNITMINNLAMSDQELKYLNLARSEPGLYCHQCRKCLPQCRHNLEIPTIMRSYMYAYGYGNMEHAQYALLEAGLTGNPCEKCEACNVKCTAGFNVKEKILDISRLKDVPREFLKTC